ncbi:MAG: hypothetical protein JWM31_3042 [Solirubrobacterales bacterium]|nr:hypothetical protein [Solirubrobacterales bacterium]
MTATRLMPQPSLTADETLAADHLLEELLAELTGGTVRALDTRRPPEADADADAQRARVEVA